MLYVFESYALDTDRRELRRGEGTVAVQPQVFDLLEFLIRNRDRVVSKDDLLGAIWGGRVVSESTLTSRINAARTALGDSGGEQRLIRTLPRKGIRFVGAVREQEFTDGAAAGAAFPIVGPPEPVPVRSGRQPTAERRQLTVASCELLVGADACLDPEDLRDVLQAYRNCVAELAIRYNGRLANAIGNTVLVYFGSPVAHEDDPEQAVKAALELIAAASVVDGSLPLSVRVGIATGLVIVGDLAGSSVTPEHGIVGETPNLAARLQGIAEPNTVVVDGGTRKLLGDLFEFQALGAAELKGLASPARAWAALRTSSLESRFEALHAGGLTALIGREEESALLLRRWSRAKTGEGQVVLLAGEPGIGKSRLTAALLESLADELHTRLRYFCSPQHTDSALYPVIGLMERAAGFVRGDGLQAKLDKLDAMLMQTTGSAQDAALFAEMLSLAGDGRHPALDLSPQQRRQRTLAALIAQIEALARKTPLLMIFEDAHWADPTTLELAAHVVDRLASLPVLLIVTFRPEFAPPWIGRSHVTALTLNRLTRSEVGELIDSVVDNKMLPSGIRQDIIERSDGVPLFVEEMTKAMLEAESEGEARRTAATITSAASAVPASLHASLMARLDRLGPAKETAQVGAAIGREFSYALVAAVAEKPRSDIDAALDRLVAAGLLFQQGVPPHATYLFKHALVQDAAYGTLLREPRRALNARIAATLQSQFPEITESQPELLARHFTEAALIEQAVSFWAKAGQRSLARSALVEAAAQFTRAIEQIETLPMTPALRREQINCQVAIITPLLHVRGYAAPEAKAAVERARFLIEQATAAGEPPEDPLLLFSVLYGFWVANYAGFNGGMMRELALQFLSLAERQGATIPLMVGHRLMGISLLCTGDGANSVAHFDRTIALYDPAAHRPLAVRFGADVRVATLFYRSWALWMLGFPQAGLADSEQALREAREIGQAATLMNTLTISGLNYIFCGDYATAGKLLDELVTLAGEKATLFWKTVGVLVRACLFVLIGKSAEAVSALSLGLGAFRSTNATLFVPGFLSYLAKAHADLGEFDAAWRCVGDAMAAIEATKENWFEAEANRMAGEIALKSPAHDAAQARKYFERALAVAREQQAKSWELRAAMSLARLLRDQDKRDEARNVLAPVHGWFTEGFDTFDLQEARALLAALAA